MAMPIVRHVKIIDGVRVPGRVNAFGDFIPERYQRGECNLLVMARVAGELKSRRKAKRAKRVAEVVTIPKRT